MGDELRLWAISMADVRQCFAAPPPLADRLLQVAQSMMPPAPASHAPGLLSKLGPLRRHPEEGAVVRPGVPTMQDASAMLSGRFIASERVDACWALMRAWLDHLASANICVPLPRDRIDALEFDLVRVGVPTHLSIRHLWRLGLDVPLRASEQMRVGHTPHAMVAEFTTHWASAAPDLVEETRAFVAPVLGFASAFAGTPESGAPLDLVAWWTSR
ncbi:MAG: hypothetical protein FWD75_05665 [Propionibacteriaceae bacterium]|nr:hypothetical protein [Propionibacteriaceae bacterium]